MKILFTNQGPWGTGSFTSVKALTEELTVLGHEVKIFFPDNGCHSQQDKVYYENKTQYEIWDYPLVGEEVSIETFPLMVPDPHPRNSTGRTFSKLSDTQLKFYFDQYRVRIKELIDRFKPDVIDCQHIWSMASGVEELGVTYFCTAHNIDQIGFKQDPRMRPFALRAATGAKKIFAISDFVKKEVVSLYDVDEKKVVVIKNGYDKKIFKPLQVEKREVLSHFNLNIPEGSYIVSFSGKISHTKGVDILLQANKILGDESKIHFLICGAGNTDEIVDENLRESVSFARVHLLGHLKMEELAQLHNIADICVAPSRIEGFGIATLEAMGCGVPVVYSDAGGMKEYAVGEMVEKENPKELARAIKKMQGLSPSEREALASQALAVAEKFSWEEIAKARLEVYGN